MHGEQMLRIHWLRVTEVHKRLLPLGNGSACSLEQRNHYAQQQDSTIKRYEAESRYRLLRTEVYPFIVHLTFLTTVTGPRYRVRQTDIIIYRSLPFTFIILPFFLVFINSWKKMMQYTNKKEGLVYSGIDVGYCLLRYCTNIYKYDNR